MPTLPSSFCVVLGACVLLSAWTGNSCGQEASKEPASPSVSKPSEVIANSIDMNLALIPSGSAKIQRNRIDDFIISTSEMSIEKAIESLNDNGATFGVVSLAGRSPSNPDSCFIKQVLADRRVSKVFQHLVEQPADLAATLASDIFEGKLKMMVENWRHMALGENPSESLGKLGPDHHAASVGLFFCSFFCSPRTFEEKLQNWSQQMSKPDFDKIEGVQFIRCNRVVDPLFRLNLLVISGSRNGLSIESLNKELDVLTRKITSGQKPFIQVKTVNLFKWNAETIDTDFTHVTRGVPATANSILIELPGFPDASPSSYLHDNQILAAVEKTINTWRSVAIH